MIKKTLFFGNPAYLNTKYEQLVINFPDKEKESKTIAIEDIGIVVLENQQITITNALLNKLHQNNVAIISCNEKHMPISLQLPLEGHSEQSQRFRRQLKLSKPLKKNLWQQTISAKINNQAAVLKSQNINHENLLYFAKHVQSGDANNHEALAAAYYWDKLFGDSEFRRRQFGEAPNNLLNYGYAILRAVCARAIVSSGLHPTLGIFHKNKYNAYCLADDIMEPYRPFVDKLVLQIIDEYGINNIMELNTELKNKLLQIPVLDVIIDGRRSPLMIAMSRTSNSLYECYIKERRKILYPSISE